jgi:Uma2 family endonuclease
MSASAPDVALLERLLQLTAEGRSVEIVAGEIVEKATPSPEHGIVQTGLGEVLAPFRRRGGGGGGPGGWWLMTEVEVAYPGGDVYRHDAVGFRRDRHAKRPSGVPVTNRPDWVAEILSPSTARIDLVNKLRTFRTAAVPHYWIVDPEHETLTVYRLGQEGYVTALTGAVGDVVRAEPFETIELSLAALFGYDDR